MSDPQRGATSPFLCFGRHAKRAAMIAQTEFWWAVSQDEKARPDGAPRPPDPWDVSISKRQWERISFEWRQALWQWRRKNLSEVVAMWLRSKANCNVAASQGELQESLPEPLTVGFCPDLKQWNCDEAEVEERVVDGAEVAASQDRGWAAARYDQCRVMEQHDAMAASQAQDASGGAAAASSSGAPAARSRELRPELPYVAAKATPTTPGGPNREHWARYWDDRRQKWSWYWIEVRQRL